MTSKDLLLVPLREVLIKSEDWIDINPTERYKQVTVKIWGKGVVERNEVTGAEIAASKRLKVHYGQFILSRIDARHGAFGLIPNSLDGAVVTNDFPVFTPNSQKILPQFLDWMSKTKDFIELCKAASEGTTNRVRLKEDKFLSMKIPLPPLEEQRRIVMRVEELVGKVEEVRSLRKETLEASTVLISVILGKFFKNLAQKFEVKSLGTLSSCITDGPHKSPNYVLTGIPFVTVRNMVTGQLNFDYLQYITLEDHAEFSKRCKPERRDVLYSKDGATRGVPCFIDTDREFNIFVSVALIKPLHDQLDGRYLCYLLNSTLIKERMIDKSKGDMIPHIVLREIRQFPVPLPPLSEQRRIVTYLDELQTKVDAMKRLRKEAIKELDALLPSILDKAFKGEL